jgi:hypothetical protein
MADECAPRILARPRSRPGAFHNASERLPLAFRTLRKAVAKMPPCPQTAERPMSTRYRPLSGGTRLIAAATAAVVSLTIVAAVAAGLTGGDAAQRWTAVPTASGHAARPT